MTTLQQDLNAIQARLEAHTATLEETLAAIESAYAKHEAIATANRDAVLLAQQRHREAEAIRQADYKRLSALRTTFIEKAKAKKEQEQ